MKKFALISVLFLSNSLLAAQSYKCVGPHPTEPNDPLYCSDYIDLEFIESENQIVGVFLKDCAISAKQKKHDQLQKVEKNPLRPSLIKILNLSGHLAGQAAYFDFALKKLSISGNTSEKIFKCSEVK